MAKAPQINETNFDQEVMQSEHPVLVDFSATWCGPCQRLAPVMDELAGELDGKVKVVKVDIDESQGLAQKYNVTSVPYVALFKSGEVVDSQLGLVGKDVFLEKINKVL